MQPHCFVCFLLFLSQRVSSTQLRPDVSSGCRSEKIEAKRLLWWSKDKSWRLLLSLWCRVCIPGFCLLHVLLCGRRLGFGFSSPVENTLLWRIWHNFDLRWGNFCRDWRNLSINSTSVTDFHRSKMHLFTHEQLLPFKALYCYSPLTALNEFVLLALLVIHFFPVISSHGSHHLPLLGQRSFGAS